MPIFRPGPESDTALRAKFSWLARSGIGVRFGSRPIGWYQAHQMCALQEIEHRAIDKLRLLHFTAKDSRNRYASEPFEVRKDRAGRVWARRAGAGRSDEIVIGQETELFRAADACSRR